MEGIQICTPGSSKYTCEVHKSEKMHSVTCSSSLPRSLPDQGRRICFPLRDTSIFLRHPPSHHQSCCWRTEFCFPLAARRCETGLQGHRPHREGQGTVPCTGISATLVKMLMGVRGSPPTLSSKEKPAKQNRCPSSHDISSFFALLNLIYNVSGMELVWFHRAVGWHPVLAHRSG